MHASMHAAQMQDGYVSEGPDGYIRKRPPPPNPLAPRRGLAAASAKPFSPTVPRGFGFEERAAARPKPISTVKLEQDLELRRQEDEAAKRYRFRANPIPEWVATGLQNSPLFST